MNDYRYELKYICDGVETVVTSPADIDAYKMKKLLRHFCECVGWSDYLIEEEIFNSNIDSN